MGVYLRALYIRVACCQSFAEEAGRRVSCLKVRTESTRNASAVELTTTEPKHRSLRMLGFLSQNIKVRKMTKPWNPFVFSSVVDSSTYAYHDQLHQRRK